MCQCRCLELQKNKPARPAARPAMIPEFRSPLLLSGKFLEALGEDHETPPARLLSGRVHPSRAVQECHCVRGIKGEGIIGPSPERL